MDEAERTEVFRRIGMGALKFFILKINPLKRMVFDPEASLLCELKTQTCFRIEKKVMIDFIPYSCCKESIAGVC